MSLLQWMAPAAETTPAPAVSSAAVARVHAVEAPTSAPLPLPRDRVWTVTELLGTVRGEVESRFRRITVEGEISNWRRAGSGHCYFTLKDGAAQVAIVMFRREAVLLRFLPKDGDSVRLTGDLTLYEARGQMQIVAATMTLAGLGAMLAAVQELKERLQREGLFARKRALPAFPHCIGIITSAEGAALRDVVKVCRRRHAAVHLLVYPAAVQGPRCVDDVVRGLAWFTQHTDRADVVLIARGGGSWEDLHGFDDERVVRAIAACPLPVVTGIGHATDAVLADNAADVCAPTPSAAAELVTAAQFRSADRVALLASRLHRAAAYALLQQRHRLVDLRVEGALARVPEGLRRRAQRVDDLDSRAAGAAERALRVRREQVAALTARLSRADMRSQLHDAMRAQARLDADLRRLGAQLAAARMATVSRLQARLDAMSPLRVLERGYALVFAADGRLLRSAADADAGDLVTATLADGSLRARVE